MKLMQITIIPFSKDNYAYLLCCEIKGSTALIDPGSYDAVEAALKITDNKLDMVLCTHHHTDHCGGIPFINEAYPNIKVYGHISGKGKILGLNHPVKDNDSFMIGNSKCKVLHTPGHTKDSICFLVEDMLFTGDTLFGAGCGRLFEGTGKEMYASLSAKIALLNNNTKLYFGHEYTLDNLLFAKSMEPGNRDIIDRIIRTEETIQSSLPNTPAYLSEEKLTNPFLRTNSPELIRSLEEKNISNDKDPSMIFTWLRGLKDNF